LFASIGITAAEDERECMIIADGSAELEDELCCHVRLPESGHPEAESERLARLLGRAVGLGRVRW